MIALAALAGCIACAPPAAAAPRIVSLSPHITELLFAAGAGGFVVGADDMSDAPAAAARLPHVGEPASLDVERLLSLHPTLVILWDSGTPPRARSELERLKIPFIATEQRHLDDIPAALLEFGRLAGTLPAATAAAERYRAALAALRASHAGRPHRTVFFQVWDRPLYTLSGSHVVSEVLSLCGGDNIFADLGTLAPAVDREAVLARDPDVILIGASGADGRRLVADWDRFAGLRAVQRHHVFSIDASLISRMTPRILDGAREVCAALDAAQ